MRAYIDENGGVLGPSYDLLTESVCQIPQVGHRDLCFDLSNLISDLLVVAITPFDGHQASCVHAFAEDGVSRNNLRHCDLYFDLDLNEGNIFCDIFAALF